jgi:hypothetical protein
VGDQKYGSKTLNGMSIELMATSVRFKHPVSKVDLEIKANSHDG